MSFSPGANADEIPDFYSFESLTDGTLIANNKYNEQYYANQYQACDNEAN
jgi:hypothetical protein